MGWLTALLPTLLTAALAGVGTALVPVVFRRNREREEVRSIATRNATAAAKTVTDPLMLTIAQQAVEHQNDQAQNDWASERIADLEETAAQHGDWDYAMIDAVRQLINVVRQNHLEGSEDIAIPPLNPPVLRPPLKPRPRPLAIPTALAQVFVKDGGTKPDEPAPAAS